MIYVAAALAVVVIYILLSVSLFLPAFVFGAVFFGAIHICVE